MDAFSFLIGIAAGCALCVAVLAWSTWRMERKLKELEASLPASVRAADPVEAYRSGTTHGLSLAAKMLRVFAKSAPQHAESLTIAADALDATAAEVGAVDVGDAKPPAPAAARPAPRIISGVPEWVFAVTFQRLHPGENVPAVLVCDDQKWADLDAYLMESEREVSTVEGAAYVRESARGKPNTWRLRAAHTPTPTEHGAPGERVTRCG